MSQHQAASSQFDRAVNSADGVGSLKHGSRTHPVHGEGAWRITVLTGTAKMEIPGIRDQTGTSKMEIPG